MQGVGVGEFQTLEDLGGLKGYGLGLGVRSFGFGVLGFGVWGLGFGLWGMRLGLVFSV